MTVTSIDEKTRRATLRVEQTVRRIRIPDEVVPEWPPRLGDPGPVERLRNDPASRDCATASNDTPPPSRSPITSGHRTWR